ncbi:hypothetical protein PLESTB_000583700 [Pleodorina starrii]|uniref:Uncharacterized protein n=1 Tax=Pleodorina starrii TaxID=330485 RepID=A0A9W6F0W7_9CHLO|nr:hypothetical protein PLESTM_000300700 [Pleodorina starrii]GLC52109.1 hypothetical protein PLESTB_000583700 [Pleodorina starrii]GLC72256.1 hypothetical protein PLESTF_001224300 [Pleodorina starrii]
MTTLARKGAPHPQPPRCCGACSRRVVLSPPTSSDPWRRAAAAAAAPRPHARHHPPQPPAAAAAAQPQPLHPPRRNLLHRASPPPVLPPRRGAPAAAAAAGREGAAPVVEPSRLVSALEKLARVGQPPQPAWLDMYLAVSEPALPALSAAEMASLARSLGRLGVEVPERWSQALLRAAEGALPSADRAADVADLVVWAAADGRLAPGPAWVGAALQQIQLLSLASPSQPPLSPVQAANVALAVARMGYRPADPLLDCLADATLGLPYRGAVPRQGIDQGRRSREMGGGGRDDPWDAARGGASEDEDSDQDPAGYGSTTTARPAGGAVPGAAGGLSELPAEQIAGLAWAFASYNYFPPDDWVQAYWLGGIWCRGLSPEGATAVLWSLGCLQLPLERMWLRNYLLATTGRLSEIPPEGLVNALWAIAACTEVARAADAAAEATAGEATGEAGSAAGPTAATGDRRQDDDGDGEEEGERRRRQELRAELEYAAGAELVERQLRELQRRLRDGTAAQREVMERLQEALDRRLAERAAAAGGGAAAAAAADAAAPPVPAAWAAEWYDATLPYWDQPLPYLDRTLVVKTLWAVATLELAPPAVWLRRLAAAAAAALAAGAMEPLELLYASRAADALLLCRRRTLATAEGEEEEAVAREELGRFAAESFTALSRQQLLPPAWRRLNPRFPPYAQPKPGAAGDGDGEGKGAAAPGRGEGEGGGAARSGEGSVGLARRPPAGPVVPGAGLLRPFR